MPPDFFACEECIAELTDPSDRRHRYPFINCTQCGPRYTLIEALPYDRPNTRMAGFVLCPRCRTEYEDPLDRRFHAEPVACPVCGPHLSFVEPGEPLVTGDEAALAAAVAVLRSGRVLAARGIGGYHLICDARSEQAVQRLRHRKRRPDKPLAVMFPQSGEDGLAAARSDLDIAETERTALLDPARPIVLVRRKPDSTLAPSVAPGLAEVGAFLPYSPLHHLLLTGFGGPVVATSGNVSGEPVLTEPAEVVDIAGDPGPAFQLRRYGWSANLSLSILSNFKELAVYDCRIRPTSLHYSPDWTWRGPRSARDVSGQATHHRPSEEPRQWRSPPK